MKRLFAAGALAFLVATSADAAAPPQHCGPPTLPTDQRIKACLAAVQTKGASPGQLAIYNQDLAAAFEAWGNRRRELDALNKAIQLDPNLWDARLARAQLLLDSEYFAQALVDFQALHKAFPKPAPVLYGGKTANGQALNSSQRIAFMIPSMQRELFGRVSNRCRNRAITGLDTAGARKDCAIAISLNPGGRVVAGPMEALGIAEFRDGDWAQALAQFQAVLKVDPKAWSSVYLSGVTERRMGKTAKGDADVALAEKNNPTLQRQGTRAGLVP